MVSTNHAQAAALIASHLFELGHRRIAYVAGPPDTEAGRARRKGFVTRMKQLSDEVELEVFFGKFDYESGEKIARDLLRARLRIASTAIAAASDQQAIGHRRAARDLNVDGGHVNCR
ncbi:substrate-binding domain-containing protein [Novosphingobium sp. MW5]|nr:substrate-binding domain-containing protein [Novosphingobium sp. MW5]